MFCFRNPEPNLKSDQVRLSSPFSSENGEERCPIHRIPSERIDEAGIRVKKKKIKMSGNADELRVSALLHGLRLTPMRVGRDETKSPEGDLKTTQLIFNL
jgi:hypothetical protein